MAHLRTMAITRDTPNSALLRGLKATTPFAMAEYATFEGVYTPQSLSSLIVAFSNTNCSDNRDKVFALRSLATACTKITVDYRSSMEALLCKILVKEQRSRKAIGKNASELVSLEKELRSALGMAQSTQRARSAPRTATIVESPLIGLPSGCPKILAFMTLNPSSWFTPSADTWFGSLIRNRWNWKLERSLYQDLAQHRFRCRTNLINSLHEPPVESYHQTNPGTKLMLCDNGTISIACIGAIEGDYAVPTGGDELFIFRKDSDSLSCFIGSAIVYIGCRDICQGQGISSVCRKHNREQHMLLQMKCKLKSDTSHQSRLQENKVDLSVLKLRSTLCGDIQPTVIVQDYVQNTIDVTEYMNNQPEDVPAYLRFWKDKSMFWDYVMYSYDRKEAELTFDERYLRSKVASLHRSNKMLNVVRRIALSFFQNYVQRRYKDLHQCQVCNKKFTNCYNQDMVSEIKLDVVLRYTIY